MLNTSKAAKGGSKILFYSKEADPFCCNVGGRVTLTRTFLNVMQWAASCKLIFITSDDSTLVKMRRFQLLFISSKADERSDHISAGVW